VSKLHHVAVVIGTTVVLALGGAATAVAGERPAGERPTRDRPASQAEKCDRLAEVIKKLARAKERIEDRIARIEALLRSGELSEEEAARARELLAGLQNRLEKVTTMLQRLRDTYAEKCSGNEPTTAAPVTR
jgi:Na+/phosphate symporter